MSYMDRIEYMKKRVVHTMPEMDLENARILTESFKETGGEPLCIRKAKAFRKQCREKTVKIWEKELIVGCPGSKMRGGILCADTCWSILDEELDTISTRKYDPFYLRPEDREMFLTLIPVCFGMTMENCICIQGFLIQKIPLCADLWKEKCALTALIV